MHFNRYCDAGLPCTNACRRRTPKANRALSTRNNKDPFRARCNCMAIAIWNHNEFGSSSPLVVLLLPLSVLLRGGSLSLLPVNGGALSDVSDIACKDPASSKA